MGVLTRFRRRRPPYAAVTEEERMSRYVYLLNTLPASVIESAHATAFADLPAAKRREMFEQLRPFLADSERDLASDDPTVLAKLVRRAEERRAARKAVGRDDAAAPAGTLTGLLDPRDRTDVRQLMMTAGVMSLVSQQFLLSAVVASYFTVGGGSVSQLHDPAWIQDTYGPATPSTDVGYGGGYEGGGHDVGGWGGGFDGGGFGGGDGGGGF